MNDALIVLVSLIEEVIDGEDGVAMRGKDGTYIALASGSLVAETPSPAVDEERARKGGGGKVDIEFFLSILAEIGDVLLKGKPLIKKGSGGSHESILKG